MPIGRAGWSWGLWLAAAVVGACGGGGGASQDSADGGAAGTAVDAGASGGTGGQSIDPSGQDAASDADPFINDPAVLTRLTFDNPEALARLRVDDPAGQVTVQGGGLQIASFSQHTAILDDVPDGKPSTLFDLARGDLVISMKVQSNSTPLVPSPALALAVLPKAWISFFGQNGRKDAARVSFNWSETANDGFVFSLGADLESSRIMAAPGAPTTKSLAVLTPMVPDQRFYEFRVSLHLQSAGVVRVVASAYDGQRLVIRESHQFQLAKTAGEIAFGGYADRNAPLLIDDFTVRQAPGDEPIAPQMVFDTSDPVHVWIPPGVTKVKGIFVDSPGCCGDSNGVWDKRAYVFNFARTYDLAVLAHVTNQDVALVEAGLRQLAEKSGHPELNTVPIVIYGFSAGSVWASKFTSQFPTRVAAYVADAASKPTDVSAGAPRAVPGVFTVGDNNDFTPLPAVRASFEMVRDAGTHQALLFKEGFAHVEMGSFFLYMPFFAKALAARSPNGTLPLLPVDEAKAWLIETDTLNSADKQNPGPMAKIVPAAGYAGALNKTGWLLDKDVAFVAAAYGSYRRALTITPPYDAVAGESREVKIRVLPSMADWSKIELFDLSGLITTFTPQDKNLQFTYANLSKGVHALSAQMTRGGKVYVSFPQTFIVTPD